MKLFSNEVDRLSLEDENFCINFNTISPNLLDLNQFIINIKK